MTIRAIYERFLSSPNPLSLSQSATLNYVTTLTSYTQQGPIVRHLESQNKNVVKKKAEKVISAVEGYNSIALEVDTTLEFLSDGGAFLPGLDNFVVDRIVTLPITHIVHFDEEEKISQIRISWDQGSLLQQVEVIGTRGRNWPITNGKEQIKMILTSSKSAAAVAGAPAAPRGRTEEQHESTSRNPSPTKKYIKDPHASLDVFDPPAHDENRRPSTADSNSVAPRESARPPPREYSELFAAGHDDLAPSPNGSPNKAHRETVIAPKGAGGRKFENSRLFEEDQDFHEPKIYKTNPARYNHFDIGDADEGDSFQHKPGSKKQEKDVPMIARTNKNASHWDFKDFASPESVPSRQRPHDQVNFDLGDQSDRDITPQKHGQRATGRKDGETHFDFIDAGTPVQRQPAQPKARKDAETHFEFRDEPTPAPRRIIARTKAAGNIYANPLEEDDEYTNAGKPPLANIKNNAGRRKDFESHWDADESPSNGAGSQKPVGQSRINSIKSMGSQWDDVDREPKETKSTMSSKVRGGFTSSWDF